MHHRRDIQLQGVSKLFGMKVLSNQFIGWAKSSTCRGDLNRLIRRFYLRWLMWIPADCLTLYVATVLHEVPLRCGAIIFSCHNHPRGKALFFEQLTENLRAAAWSWCRCIKAGCRGLPSRSTVASSIVLRWGQRPFRQDANLSPINEDCDESRFGIL